MKNKILLSVTVITILLITIGLSYAYFSANLTGGEEATTITVTGGTMNIVYNGGPNINVENIIPKVEPATIKIFTVTGNNTMDIPMGYKLSLIVESNTFSEEALKYKLISINTDANGEIIQSVTELTNIGAGSRTIELGIGTFEVPTGGNKVHTYNLEIYFPNANYNQNEDQGKEFKAHINIINYIPMLKDKILAQGGGAATIEAKGDPDFSKIAVSQSTYDNLPDIAMENPEASKEIAAVENGIYATEDEYGISYYYRGKRELLDNNLIFAGFQWKIIRINGDGSIRIIYNGTNSEFKTNKTMNTTGRNTQINGLTYAWNLTNQDDKKYVGYMYGGLNGVASTSRENAILNETSSNSKVELDNWYQLNILGKSFESKIVDNLFCNERELEKGLGGEEVGSGYGTDNVTYASAYRLVVNKAPTLKCEEQNDRFTVSDTTIGNGALTYPVGLITADEASMAGLLWYTNNSENYLNTNEYYWTFSPYGFYYQNTAYVFRIGNGGDLHGSIVNLDDFHGLRPILNLNSEIKVMGEGTVANPFIVVN